MGLSYTNVICAFYIFFSHQKFCFMTFDSRSFTCKLERSSPPPPHGRILLTCVESLGGIRLETVSSAYISLCVLSDPPENCFYDKAYRSLLNKVRRI